MLVQSIGFTGRSNFCVIYYRFEEAKFALSWLRHATQGVEQELEELRNEVVTKSAEPVSSRDLFTRGVYLKPFSIAMGLMFFQQFNGVNAVIFYTQTIFDSTGISLDPGNNISLKYFF